MTKRNLTNAWRASSDSWRAAKALHLTSLNSRSTCSLARSFLARAITDGKTESTIQHEYGKYLNKCPVPKHRRRKRKRSTVANRTVRNWPGRRRSQETNEVENLMLVKKFMNEHGLDITQMHKIIATMRYLELLGTRKAALDSKKWVGHTKSDSFLVSRASSGDDWDLRDDRLYRVTKTAGPPIAGRKSTTVRARSVSAKRPRAKSAS